jgi:hypothetical protein
MGGCVSNNVHGKNGFRQGNFGECVREVSLLTAEGRLLVCSPWGHGELFRAVVGGMGLLGVLVEITLQLARLPHPALRIRKFTAPGIHELVASLENVKVQNDLAIGQVDAFARGGGASGEGQFTTGRSPKAAVGLAPMTSGVGSGGACWALSPNPWLSPQANGC